MIALALSASLWLTSSSRANDDQVDDPTGREVVDLSPETPPAWSFRYVAAPVVALFRGSGYIYSPRRVQIETTPADGFVDLFYVRSGFQKRFEQAESPVTVILPSRLETGPRDSFTVRAFADGYRPKTVTLPLSEGFDDVDIDLEPLPNALEIVSHRYFDGRSSIEFLTPEALTFRVQEADDGFAVILNETAISDAARAAVDGIRSPLIDEGYSQQLGTDLVIKLVLVDQSSRDSIEVRSRQRYDAPRDLHEFVLDVMPIASETTRVSDALAALAALGPSDILGCRLALDDALRQGIDPGDLARALRPRGAFTDRYLRAAMRRLGEISTDGIVDFVDGLQLRPGSQVELEMAIGNAATAKGFLALLDAFVARLEVDPAARPLALQSLLAPEMSTADFASIVERARQREMACK